MPTKHGNVLSWASDIEPNTIEQAQKTASLPFISGHLALMPDAHVGIGATVGSVIPTRGAIIPAAVGVDIGCGMIAVETNLTADRLPDTLDPLLSSIGQAVPAGVGKGHERQHAKRDDILGDLASTAVPMTDDQWKTATRQFGSLGSGNHFVEVCLDESDTVWLVLHSGSRGIGNQLAKEHIDGAKGLMKRYFIDLPDPDLAYYVEGTPEFDAYIAAMLWAQDYALANREAMMDAVINAVEVYVQVDVEAGIEQRRINCHHNFTEMENHHGKNVWLTRKGAIRARTGDLGVIPGSMGTRSYIVSGAGNPASYFSCSHGAGRRLSRGAARKTLTVESLHEAMGDRTWLAGNAEALLDEHPDSYKDIDVVMADQSDLVTVEHTLRQVLNYKGL